jgi:2-hydroxy-6-oxonona-2,4-dienedioate hydrolase
LSSGEPRNDGAWLTIAGLRYFYRAVGADRPDVLPVALIHGLGVSSDYWARLMPLLAARRRVYALDLPGFGRTEDPPAIWDGPQMARAVAAWLDALGVRHAHVLAHSQGAQIAAELASDRPELAASLVLAGATIGRRDPLLPRLALRLLRDAPREDPTLLPVVGRAYFRAGLWRMLLTCSVLNNEDSVATLARLHQPIMIVRGARDPVVTAWSVEQLVRAAPQARAVAVPRAPHGLHWSHPRTLGGHVNAFLARVHARSGSAPRARRAARGRARKRRVAAVILVVPRARIRPMAALRKAAITGGACPARVLERSSAKVVSRI